MTDDTTGVAMERVVLVDEEDSPLGLHGKVEAHLGEGALHRAFTTLLFDSAGRVLIAKRSRHKMLWPLVWDSACASHPREEESYVAAGQRRLLEELAIACCLYEADKFTYHARFQDVGCEREVCATLLGVYDGEVQANPAEVDEWAWVGVRELREEFALRSDDYAPWFAVALDRLILDGTVSILDDGSVVVFADKSPGPLMEVVSSLVEPSIRMMLSGGIRVEHQEQMLQQVASGGKRFRPTLAVLSCLACGGSLDQVLHAAASLEVLHNATLITDDIIDHGEIRRGLPTMWKKHGSAFAECAALTYTASVYEGLAMQNRLDLAPLLTNTMKSIVDGELIDILFDACGREDEDFIRRNRPSEVDLQDYEEMIALKTATLMSAACQLGGACAYASSEELDALRDFGACLGMLFQVQDDILDIYGDVGTFGKQIGKDICEHKRGNAVLLHGLQAMPPGMRQEFVQLFQQDEHSPEDIQELVEMLDGVHARKRVEPLAERYATESRAALLRLPQSSWTEALGAVVEYCRERCR